mmetsp:Transcript_18012/g.18226  ORF Transcript_18012/g.18226 Transcript_18012/m.18226 type:complete len:134 (-) Transcript_18012:1194-1595(-)
MWWSDNILSYSTSTLRTVGDPPSMNPLTRYRLWSCSCNKTRLRNYLLRLDVWQDGWPWYVSCTTDPLSSLHESVALKRFSRAMQEGYLLVAHLLYCTDVRQLHQPYGSSEIVSRLFGGYITNRIARRTHELDE